MRSLLSSKLIWKATHQKLGLVIKKLVFTLTLSRSDVFNAMLTSPEWAEAANNQLTIDDFEPSVVKGMLHFVYTGELPDGDQNYLE